MFSHFCFFRHIFSFLRKSGETSYKCCFCLWFLYHSLMKTKTTRGLSDMNETHTHHLPLQGFTDIVPDALFAPTSQHSGFISPLRLQAPQSVTAGFKISLNQRAICTHSSSCAPRRVSCSAAALLIAHSRTLSCRLKKLGDVFGFHRRSSGMNSSCRSVSYRKPHSFSHVGTCDSSS